MLINNKLNKCKGCEGIQTVIESLDCFIGEQGYKLLNNKRYALSNEVNEDALRDAVRYKNILIKRSYNPTYLQEYNITDILSKAKQVTY